GIRYPLVTGVQTCALPICLLQYKSLAWEVQILRRQINANSEAAGLIGESRIIQDILAMISKVAPTSSNVLITGESGVGKEVVARSEERRVGEERGGVGVRV